MGSIISFIKEHKKRVIVIAAIVVAVAALLTGGIVMAQSYASKRLPDAAELNGVSIGGLTVEELSEVLDDEINPKLQGTEVKLQFGEAGKTVKAGDFDFEYNAETVFAEAKKFDFSSDQQFHPSQDCDKQKLKESLKNFQEETRVAVTPYSYEKGEETVEVTAGKPGGEFDVEQGRRDLVEQIERYSLDPKTVTLESREITDETIAIDLDAIYKEVHTAVKDASYSINSSGILSYDEEQPGVSFDIEQAKEIVTDPQNGTYSIPLIYTQPSVTVSQLRQEHDSANCPDLLYSFTTKYSASDSNRNFNIARAASILSGTVLYPGERFSFSSVVGYTNKANGYKEATVYTPSGTDTGYGGGVCQVSTTVYNAALFSYMEITERRNHSYTVGYVPLGQDAAVSDGGQDMCFINTRDNPVKVVATTTGTSITVSIYGTKSDMDNYKVSLSSASSSAIAFGVKYQDNPNLPLGQERTVSNGKNGYNVSVTKTVTYNGSVVETSVISSYYKPLDKVVERGTAAVQQPAPPPAETPQQPTEQPQTE